MKKTFLMLTAAVMLLISACRSDRQTNSDSDSLMNDTSTMDSATMSTDTTSMGTGQTSPDSTAINP
jgi:hypothetical protein